MAFRWRTDSGPRLFVDWTGGFELFAKVVNGGCQQVTIFAITILLTNNDVPNHFRATMHSRAALYMCICRLVFSSTLRMAEGGISWHQSLQLSWLQPPGDRRNVPTKLFTSEMSVSQRYMLIKS